MVEGLVAHPDVKVIYDTDGAVLLHERDGIYFSVNAVGAAMWRHLAAGRTHDAIVSEIAAATAIDPGRIEQDLQRFVERLRQQNLIVPGEIVSAEAR